MFVDQKGSFDDDLNEVLRLELFDLSYKFQCMMMCDSQGSMVGEGFFLYCSRFVQDILGGVFKNAVYFSAGVYLVGKGSFKVCKLSFTSILCRVDAVVSEGLALLTPFLVARDRNYP